jgi:hypothetical protein
MTGRAAGNGSGLSAGTIGRLPAGTTDLAMGNAELVAEGEALGPEAEVRPVAGK